MQGAGCRKETTTTHEELIDEIDLRVNGKERRVDEEGQPQVEDGAQAALDGILAQGSGQVELLAAQGETKEKRKQKSR